jgi:tRNA uridine 5-carboxymethylaminomethyl modification enzyme
MSDLRYDVVVIGGGLSACEAAHAAARMGCETLLLAADLGRLADLSLNARMGGPVRGILVREVEALGGLSGRAADAALLHIRLVNEARGPAHRALRAALDPAAFTAAIRQALAGEIHLTLQQGVVTAIDRDADAALWVVAVRGAPPIRAQAVVLALGTAVHQHICVGRDRETRHGAEATLADRLAALVPLARYHIAHPPLLDRATIDVRHAEALLGSSTPLAFSCAKIVPLPPEAVAPVYDACVQRGWRDQLPSYRLATTLATNAVVASAWSPVIRGLTSRGPEGCDPLEWIVAGVPAARQALILESASWSAGAVYLRGAYTALGVDDQMRFIATVPGLEQARMLRPGMLVEYDGVATGALGSDLSVRNEAGLYAAGAFAGGNGNEESAALGVVAGINAARYAQRRAPLVVDRADAYIGVLVDDLSQGAGLPYRIANARVADRTGLRDDNADLRLTPLAGELGLSTPHRVLAARRRQAAVDAAIAALRQLRVAPTARTNARLTAAGLAPLRTAVTAEALLRRPHTTYAQIQQALDMPPLDAAAAAIVEAEVLYATSRARSAS